MERSDHLQPGDLDREDWNSLKNNYDKHDIGEAYFTGRMHQIGLQIEHWGIDMRDDDESGLIFDDKMDLRLWEPQGDYGEPGMWPSDSFVSDVEVEIDEDLSEESHSFDGESGDSASEVAADGGLPHYHTDYDPDTGDRREWVLKGVCDIKTKANPNWLGIFNLRHLAHYAHWANEYDVPVFLYFTLVDMESEKVGEKNILVEVPAFDNYYDYVRHFDRDSDYSFDVMGHIADDCPIVQRAFRAPDGNPVVGLHEDAYQDFDYVVENVL